MNDFVKMKLDNAIKLDDAINAVCRLRWRNITIYNQALARAFCNHR